MASLALLHHGLLRATTPATARPPVDHAAIGRAWQQAGHEPLACKVLEAAGAHLDGRVLQLAASYRRRGEWARAEALWLQLHAGGSTLAACELSKLLRAPSTPDYRRAMDFAVVCETSERRARRGRLQERSGSNLSLPLAPDW